MPYIWSRMFPTKHTWMKEMFSNFWSAVCRVDFACLRDLICFLSFSISFLNRERFSFCLLLTRLFTRSTASSTDWYNCLLFPSSLSMVSLSEHWEEISFEFSSKSRIKFQTKCKKRQKKIVKWIMTMEGERTQSRIGFIKNE